MEIFNLDTTEWALVAIVLFFLLIQTLYYLCLYNKMYRHNKAVKAGEVHFSQELPPVSVIITAREECNNLRQNLTDILEQDYPQFEVIVVNDGNTDESEDYLTLLQEHYPHLYHSFVPASSRYISRKKLAISIGIKAAKYEWLLFTEANCRPVSNQWLRLMARNFTSHTDVVLGYSGYRREKEHKQRFINFDNLFNHLRFLGCALAGKPYMGLGRNLAYRKSLFFRQKGFTEHLHLQHGADDLFVNQVAKGSNTRVECEADAVVRMSPVMRNKLWREEKIGYTSTSFHYHGLQRWLLGLETTSRLLFHASWMIAIVVGILKQQWLLAGIGLLLFILRYLLQAIIINKTAKQLNESYRFYFLLPWLDILQPLQSLRWKLYCRFRKKAEFMRK